MPDTNHHKGHRDNGAVLAEDVDEDLEHRLIIRGVNSVVEVLDRKEEADDVEEAENRGHNDAGQYPDGCGVGGAVRFFGEVGGGVKAWDCSAGNSAAGMESGLPVIVYWLSRMPQMATYAGDARTDQPGLPVPS